MTEYCWKSHVAKAQVCGSASSAVSLSDSKDIFFFVGDTNRVVFQSRQKSHYEIWALSDVPVRTFHFQGLDATYTRMNLEDQYVTEAFTRAIREGVFRLIGQYSCANVLCGTQNSPAAYILTAQPVPILFNEDETRCGAVKVQKVRRGAQTINIYRAHFGGDQNVCFHRQRLYMVGATQEPGPDDIFTNKLKDIYNMRIVKNMAANGKDLVTFRTKNLYVVADCKRIIAVGVNVMPGREYMLMRSSRYSERSLTHSLHDSEYFDNAEKGKLLVMVEGMKVYAKEGLEVPQVRIYVEEGFEANNLELANFWKFIERFSRVVKHRGKPMALTEMAKLSHSTPRQVLGYFCRVRRAMPLLSGETCAVGEAGIGEKLFIDTQKHPVRKLLGLTLIRLGEHTFRLRDGVAVYVSKEDPEHLTTDSRSGRRLLANDVDLVVRAV